MVLVKIGSIFLLIILLLRLKVPLGLTIIFSGLILGIFFKLAIPAIVQTAWVTLCQTETISLTVLIALILILSELLSATGQLTALSHLIVKIIGLHRLTYTILPALIGLLPMPGGALFSAPLLDNIGQESLPAHKKTLINYWFRHIWEYAWPLYPGLLLAAGLAHLNLNTLALYQAPLIIISALSGIIFILPGIKLLNPGSPADKSFKLFIRLFYLSLPIVLIVILFLSLHLSALLCVLISFLWVIIDALFTEKLKAPKIIKITFGTITIYQMILTVISILIFTGILQASSLISELEQLFSTGAGNTLPLAYVLTIIILLPFIIGLLTGMTVAFIGITFPIILALEHTGIATLPTVMLAYVSGISGVMLSPLHLCLILTNQYYGSSLKKVYAYLIPITTVVFASALILFFIYSRILK
jgi:uncharacterized protein